MAATTHELYIGGPSRGDTSRHQFPAKTFSASGTDFASIPPAAHKGPQQYALTRVIDLGYDQDAWPNDPALRDYADNNALAASDILNLVIVPANTLLYGVAIQVETAATGSAASTAVISLAGTAISTAVSLKSKSSGMVPAGGTAAAPVTAGAVTLAVASFSNKPRIIAATIGVAASWDDLKDLRLLVSPLVSAVHAGQY